MAFYTGGSERMRIDTSGNVGIGTSSPGAKLNVSGTVEANGSLYRAIFGGASQDGDMTGITGGNGAEVQIQAATSSRRAVLSLGGALANGEALGSIAFYNSNNTDGKRLRAAITGGVEGATANEQGGVLIFQTAANAGTTPSERMRIASNGSISAFALASGAGTATLKIAHATTGVISFDTSSRLVKENIENSTYGLTEVLQLQPRKYFRTDDQQNEIGLIADEVVDILPELVPIAQ
jgi:hypothetical protein